MLSQLFKKMDDDEDLEAILAADLAALRAEPKQANDRAYGEYGAPSMSPIEATARELLAAQAESRAVQAWKEYTSLDFSLAASVSDGPEHQARGALSPPSTNQTASNTDAADTLAANTAGDREHLLSQATMAARIVSLWAASDAVQQMKGAALDPSATVRPLQRPPSQAATQAPRTSQRPTSAARPSTAMRVSPIYVSSTLPTSPRAPVTSQPAVSALRSPPSGRPPAAKAAARATTANVSGAAAAGSRADRSSAIDGSGPGRPSPAGSPVRDQGGGAAVVSTGPPASPIAVAAALAPEAALEPISLAVPDLNVDVAALMREVQARARAEAEAIMARERERWRAELEAQQAAERAKEEETKRKAKALEEEAQALANAAADAAAARAAAAEAAQLAARARLEQRSSLLLQAHVRGWMARRKMRLADLIAAAREAKARADAERRRVELATADAAARAEKKRLDELKAQQQAAAAEEARKKAEQERAEALAREAALEEQRRLALELETRQREEGERVARETAARRLALNRAGMTAEDGELFGVNVAWRKLDALAARVRCERSAMSAEEDRSKALARVFAAEARAREESRRAALAAVRAAMAREDAASAVLSRLARLEEVFSRPVSANDGQVPAPRSGPGPSGGASQAGSSKGSPNGRKPPPFRMPQPSWAVKRTLPGQQPAAGRADDKAPAAVLQAAWRGRKARADPSNPLNVARGRKATAAAVRIQAMWRGYRLRAALHYALEAARFDEADPLTHGGHGGGAWPGEDDDALLDLPDLPEHLLQPIKAGPGSGPAPAIPLLWGPAGGAPAAGAGGPAYSPLGTPDRRGAGHGQAGHSGGKGTAAPPVRPQSSSNSAEPRPDSGGVWELSSVRSGPGSRGSPLRPGTAGTTGTDNDPRAPTAGTVNTTATTRNDSPGRGAAAQAAAGAGQGGQSESWRVSAATAELMARRRDKMLRGGGREGHVGAVALPWSNAVAGDIMTTKPSHAMPLAPPVAVGGGGASSFVGRVRGAVGAGRAQAWTDGRSGPLARMPSVQDNLPDHLRPGAGHALSAAAGGGAVAVESSQAGLMSRTAGMRKGGSFAGGRPAYFNATSPQGDAGLAALQPAGPAPGSSASGARPGSGRVSGSALYGGTGSPYGSPARPPAHASAGGSGGLVGSQASAIDPARASNAARLRAVRAVLDGGF